MITGAYFPEISGAGLQCRSLISRAADNSLRFCVITTCKDSSLPYRDTVDSVPVYRLHLKNRPALGNLASWLPRLVHLWLEVIRQADILHFHGFSRKSYLFFLLGRLAGKKLAIKLTSLGEDDPVSVLRQAGALRRFFFSRADYYLAASPALEDSYRQSGLAPERLEVIPNGVDTSRFAPADSKEKSLLRDSLGLPADEVLILFVGHFSAEKRPDFLARAWSGMKHPRTGLVLVGATDLSHYEVSPEVVESVKETAGQPGLPGALVYVERAERIEDYFRACDLFVLPSVREGLPNALLEAMASGLACVSARLPGITDRLIRHQENGMLFEPDNREALERILQELISDPGLRQRLGQRSRETACREYDLDRVARKYRDFYFKAAVS